MVGLVFSPNSQTLTVATVNKTIVSWNVAYNPGQPAPPEFGKLGQIIRQSGALSGLAFLPDATLCTSSHDGLLRTWKFASETPLMNLYLAFFERMGAPIKQFGDSTGVLKI